MEAGWVTACKYEDELRDMLKERTGGNKEKVGPKGIFLLRFIKP